MWLAVVNYRMKFANLCYTTYTLTVAIHLYIIRSCKKDVCFWIKFFKKFTYEGTSTKIKSIYENGNLMWVWMRYNFITSYNSRSIFGVFLVIFFMKFHQSWISLPSWFVIWYVWNWCCDSLVKPKVLIICSKNLTFYWS